MELNINANPSKWGKYKLYSLTNSQGSRVDISNLGAIIANFIVFDKNKLPHNIVLGYDTPREYIQGKCYLGCVVGPWANRIDSGSLNIDGIKVQLHQNEGDNHLHGGSANIGDKCWDVVDVGDNFICLRTSVCKGEAGYPADIHFNVLYQLTDANELVIEYNATPDGKTPINVTQHTYFNLDGSDTILDHSIQIDSETLLIVDENAIPEAKIKVKETPFDLRQSTVIRDNISQDDHQLTAAQGFDHCWCFEPDGIEKFASVSSNINGLTLEVYSDQIGMQFYSGNFLDNEQGRDGAIYQQHAGLCLETQCYPNQVNMANSSDCIFEKGETYQHKVIYKVSSK
ncbi:galactose mutarotase [Vibrio cholerae]|uniref:aldose epimerase family protein n=1 Tax=Vibrio TaxID=662 RepID=UPI0004E3C51B|nr:MULTISPECIES: aldose epimerase family protein [Vibrio]KFD81891.1 aldose 1-epimerase family protein [Vibrio paracholerae]QAV06891.1 Aldose 1-epimerase [Vibrio cholerae]TXX92289.1 galactose mutarotase [Vibrio cholerae]TXX93515.1 galactose mutarotase [Vibrio cholerae]GHW11577.1 galactose mutarotase [Vibrio cholerae]